MWIVKTNKHEKISTEDLLEGLEVFIRECGYAELYADSLHPRTIDLIQSVKLDNGVEVEYPYFTNTYK